MLTYATSTSSFASFAKEMGFRVVFIPFYTHWEIHVKDEEEFELLKKLWEENGCEPNII